MLALTQYHLGRLYSLIQVERLSLEMKATMPAVQDIKLDMNVTLKNSVAAFKFQCSRLNESGECETFILVAINKRKQARVGAEIVVVRDCLNNFRQGDTGILERKDEGPSGWWARFSDGAIWNVGLGCDFFVLT